MSWTKTLYDRLYLSANRSICALSLSAPSGPKEQAYLFPRVNAFSPSLSPSSSLSSLCVFTFVHLGDFSSYLEAHLSLTWRNHPLCCYLWALHLTAGLFKEQCALTSFLAWVLSLCFTEIKWPCQEPVKFYDNITPRFIDFSPQISSYWACV